MHQEIFPATITSRDMIWSVPAAGKRDEKIFSLDNKTTPKKPVKIPSTILALLRFSFRFLLSNNTIHNGAEETKTATKELGSVSSAQIIAPFPINKSRLPTMNEVFICGRYTNLYFFIAHHPSNIKPEAKNLMAPKIKGGKSLSDAWIKK
jgi:hypothetical protein